MKPPHHLVKKHQIERESYTTEFIALKFLLAIYLFCETPCRALVHPAIRGIIKKASSLIRREMQHQHRIGVVAGDGLNDERRSK